MCGEKRFSAVFHREMSGSPPHVRGKAAVKGLDTRFLGITPACAGKSTRWRAGRTYTKDHPRMCGEKHQQPKAATAGIGSPPHVRGKVTQHALRTNDGGITPACAGKRSFCSVLQASWRDHPRMCGEKKIMRGGKDKRMGSPPHVRGKADLYISSDRQCGITPACAGKRGTLDFWHYADKDHPRMCGEKL